MSAFTRTVALSERENEDVTDLPRETPPGADPGVAVVRCLLEQFRTGPRGVWAHRLLTEPRS